MNMKRPQQFGTGWGRLLFRWGLGAETGSPFRTLREGHPFRVLPISTWEKEPNDRYNPWILSFESAPPFRAVLATAFGV